MLGKPVIPLISMENGPTPTSPSTEETQEAKEGGGRVAREGGSRDPGRECAGDHRRFTWVSLLPQSETEKASQNLPVKPSSQPNSGRAGSPFRSPAFQRDVWGMLPAFSEQEAVLPGLSKSLQELFPCSLLHIFSAQPNYLQSCRDFHFT